jgi:hypothetical protein
VAIQSVDFSFTGGAGVYRTEDGGGTWAALNRGLTLLRVDDLAVTPSGDALFAGTDGGGVFRLPLS